MKWEEFKEQLMKNPDFRAEYERLAADYERLKLAIQQHIAEKQTDIEATIRAFTKIPPE
jgi:hypothetical protein